MEYKVGDTVRIARVNGHYSVFPMYDDYIKMVGQSYKVIRIHCGGVTLDTPKHGYWDFTEIEIDKSKIIHDILQEL